MAQIGIGVTVTNTNPVRTMMPRPLLQVQRSIDGLSYLVTKPDGTTVAVAPAVVDALLVEVPAPMPLLDRPKGASAK